MIQPSYENPIDVLSIDTKKECVANAVARVPRSFAIELDVLPIDVRYEKYDEVLIVAAADAAKYRRAQDALRARSHDRSVHLVKERSVEEDAVLRLRVASRADRIEFRQATDPSHIARAIIQLYGPERPRSADKLTAELEDLLAQSVYQRIRDWETTPLKRGGVLEGMVDDRWMLLRRFETDLEYLQFVRLLKQRAAGGMLRASQSNEPQDGRFSIDLPHRTVEARLNVMPMDVRYAGDEPIALESAWLRIHDYSLEGATPEHLGTPEDVLCAMDEALVIADPLSVKHPQLFQPRGIIYLIGPQGVGKTTTLIVYVKDRVIPRGHHVMTMENPRELRVYGIAQVEMDDSGMTFANIARAHKRRRYFLTVIGEGRDTPSMMAGLEAAGTGGLVAQTAHGDDAVAFIPKAIIDFKVPFHLLSQYGKLFVAQRLVSRLCSDCKVPVEAPAQLVALRPEAAGATIFEARGCEICFGTGYRGQLAVFEKFIPTPAFWRSVRDGAVVADLYAAAMRDGYRPMFEHGLDRLMAGETSFGELLKKVPRINQARPAGRRHRLLAAMHVRNVRRPHSISGELEVVH